MDRLAIRTLRNRYRLLGGAPEAWHKRLAHALGEVLDAGLEAALAQAALPADEHICLRRVQAQVNLSATQSDTRLALDWSAALAAAIELSVARGGPSVVRYPSRRHAVMDFAMSVAAGDLSRAWAWRQLQLLPAGAVTSLEAAERALLDALEGDGAAVVPVLAALASRARLERLSAQWTAQDWRRLARSALAAHGLPQRLAEGDPNDAAGAPATAMLSLALEARLQRTLERSALAQLLRAPAPEQRRARTLLVLLAGDPSLLRAAGGSSSALLLSALGRSTGSADSEAINRGDARLHGPRSARRARDRASLVPDVPAQHAREDSAAGAPSQRSEADRPTTADELVRASAPDPRVPRTDMPAANAASDAVSEQHGPAQLDARSLQTAAPAPAADAITAQLPEDLRKRGRTQWGGLLFLLWLIEPAAIREVAEQPPLGGRSLRWVLHLLALRLVPAKADDPALLAFAGLPPDAAPPSLEEASATPEEEAAVAHCKDRIVAALRARMGSTQGTDAQLLREVCERHGEIVADPGWIELHLAADQVSTAIRRCGLDLNPDFLPWLGVVVRFVYG